jgi:hypothetical protein
MMKIRGSRVAPAKKYFFVFDSRPDFAIRASELFVKANMVDLPKVRQPSAFNVIHQQNAFDSFQSGAASGIKHGFDIDSILFLFCARVIRRSFLGWSQ